MVELSPELHELLEAEAQYLAATGWKPVRTTNNNGEPELNWRSPRPEDAKEGPLKDGVFFQVVAVLRQKKEDKLIIVPDPECLG
jgi:hypothetical protein